ncbi:MAG: hypothetical protein ACMVY4_18085 [Minwuia sp.]|uniref:hypothetical protein n=1 Tax=Minwuia sp. TaxID=2493630 RepID=UPI003A89C55B
MMLDQLARIAELASSVFTMIGVAFAIFAALVSYRSFRQARMLNREVIARQIYASAVQSFADNPKFAEPMDIEQFNDQEIVKYRWLITGMLNALDEMLTSSAKEDFELWRNVLRQITKLHFQYITSIEFATADRPTYSKVMMGIIDERIAELT